MTRAVDIVLAVFVLLISSPVLSGFILLDRLFPEKFIFKQSRIGRNKVQFIIYKLRTMPLDTVHGETKMVLRNGLVAINPVHQLLRKTRLDELPQLINILKGEMSWVGPRPCLPSQVELICAREELNLFSLRPGLAGPAQAAGLDMSKPSEVAEADALLLKEKGLKSYFGYLFRSIDVIFRGV
jgi:O-antigen biosynthesis protein WbqP